MRVTDGMRYASVRRYLTTASARHAEAFQQASTGQRVNSPGGDPVAAATLVRLRSAQAATASYRSGIDTVSGDVALAESTLAEAADVMAQAREIALQGSNDTLSASERSLLADQLRGLKERLVGLANTRGARGYVFGGTATTTAAFAADGSFLGNDEVQLLEVGPGQTSVVNASGARAFTAAGGTDVFLQLDGLITALAANDGVAVRATLPGVEAARDQLVEEQARTGLKLERLTTSDEVLDTLEVALAAESARIGEVDVTDAYTRLTELSEALDRAVTVSRSLLDVRPPE